MSLHASKPCCTIPPVVNADYTAKGTYKKLGGFNSYITGPADAKKAIYFLYDIFGYSEPTLQGADILASAGYLVVMPDLFDGEYCQGEWFAQDTDEKKQKLGAFMGQLADAGPHVERVGVTLEATKKEFSGVESWGAIGYCWGGKLVALTSGANTPWKVGVQTSPAKVDAEDAKKVTIPMALLASKDEPADDVKAFGEALTTDKHMETFSTQVHGFMSARADLKDEACKKEYIRGYEVALEFICKHLGKN